MIETHVLTGKRLSVVRVLAILAIIASVVSLVSGNYAASNLFDIAAQIYDDPNNLGSISMQSSQVREAVIQSGFASSLDYADATVGTLVLLGSLLSAGAFTSLIPIVSGVCLLRLSSRPQHGYAFFVAAVAGSAIAFLTVHVVAGALLAVAAYLMYVDYTEHFGKDNDFTSSNHLGFMRVIEVACIITLLSNMAMVLYITKSSMFNADYWVAFVQVIMTAITLWLIWNRKEHGREIIIAMVVIYMVINLAVMVFITSYSPFECLIYSIAPIVMLVYFVFSKRAKVFFNRPFRDDHARAEVIAEEKKLWNPRSLAFWRDLLLIFCIFSVVGHWMEWCVCWLIRLGWVPGTYDPNSGIWHDMLNPFFVYGAAMFFIGLLLSPLKVWLQEKLPRGPLPLIASFLVNTAFCAAIELAMGLVLNNPVGTLWDYTDMAFNFMGQICLLNTAFFGVMATLMTWLVYPNLERAFSKMPRDVMNILTVIVLVFFVMVVGMYVINLSLPFNR